MSEKMEKVENKKKTKGKVKVFQKKKKKDDPEKALIEKLQTRYETIDVSAVNKFGDLPLSPKLLKGLRQCGYHKPTDIQKATVALSLQGKDILGAAQTGSGKTLAFLIPLLETLFRKQWTNHDGVGALIITPTRELAYQIFETLRKVGLYHDFSAGLIIGGKDLKFERARMDQCNIVVCTPGRLLQHMDENPLFNCDNLQVLVLDEADRCLDMGFEQTMNAIIANLPIKRQTMLFSATQTKSVKDLARLSLKDPSYISVHETSEFGTPKELQQQYVVCELQDKVAILWSFIKNHLKKKIIIFFSSCKQVKYMFEIFSKLRPGTSLMPLYGTLHQLRRMEIYESFCRKQSAVLFATDLAARGLDFPEVHWVVQADCPEDAATYIHRVGRTARYHRGGESMILLLNSEVKMVERLEEKKIPINKTDINPMKLNNPVRKIEAFLAKDPTLKDSAQRAFVSYAKAVFLMKDKEIFNVQALDTDSYAHSLGLAIPPRIRFLQRLNARQEQHKNIKNKDIPIVFNKEISSNTKKIYFDDDEKVNNKEDIRYSDDEIVNNEEEESESEEKTEDRTEKLISKSPKKKQNKVKEKPREKLREKPVLKNEDKFEKITSEDSGVSDDEETFKRITKQQEKSTPFHVSDDSDDDDDILQVKRKDHDIELPTDQEMAVLHLGRGGKKKPVTKAALVKKLTKKKIVCNKKTFFDDEGEAVTSGTREKKSELAQEYENADEGGIDFEKAKLILKEEDKFDKQLFKEKVKAKHKEEKRKLKEQKKLERDQEKDEFGESDSEEEPDLSWLPDPDKIYGKRNSDEEDPEFYEPTPNDEETEKSEETVKKSKKESKTKTKKRKLKGNMDNLETVLKKKKKQKIEQISSSLSVNEAEELAMMLLSKK